MSKVESCPIYSKYKESHMLKKFLVFIMILLGSSPILFSEIPDEYQKKLEAKKYLKLPDGREILISQPGNNDKDLVKKRVFMRNNKEILWDKTFNSEYGDVIWQGAHFIPVAPGKFYFDHDKDGYEEIAIAVWHGGQSPDSGTAFVFSLRSNDLVLIKKEPINYEFSKYVYRLID